MSSENRTSVPNSLNEHWMPFTSNKDFKQIKIQFQGYVKQNN